MPLARYCSFVGGVLLALMFILDACFPKLLVPDRALVDLPVIRIHSDRKWPERIVYDTSLPAMVPTSAASPEVVIQAPGMMVDVSAGARKWQAFAMLPPSGEQSQASDAKMREQKPRRQSKIVGKRSPVPRVVMARHLQFRQFGQFDRSGRSFW
jgi:hypothetical protein